MFIDIQRMTRTGTADVHRRSTPHNPYTDRKGRPLLRRSVVLFADILGFKAWTQKIASHPERRKLFLHLRDSIRCAIDGIHPPSGGRIGFKDLYRVKTFTDNIVIGFPLLDDGEGELGSVAQAACSLQTKLCCDGYFLRGAISIGEVYMDDDVAFGQGIIDAFEAEQTTARDPRIVLTKSAEQFMVLHLSYYAFPDQSPQSRVFLEDVDGRVFVNYLSAVIEPLDYNEPADVDTLHNHKAAVTTYLTEFADDPYIWSKYRWAAAYHNHFCQANFNRYKKLRIPIQSFVTAPRGVVTDERTKRVEAALEWRLEVIKKQEASRQSEQAIGAVDGTPARQR